MYDIHGWMGMVGTDAVSGFLSFEVLLQSITLSLFIKILSPSFSDRELLQNENFDTRDFTIFIANKQWIKNILRPLLELCAKDDSMLAMRCCGLALVLVRRLSDESQKTIKQLTSKTRKASSQDLQANEEDKDELDKDNGNDIVTKNVFDTAAKNVIIAQRKVSNVQQQLAALLSFKEALCSGKWFL